MTKLTLSTESLKEVNKMVKEQLPVPANGAKLKKTTSSVNLEISEEGGLLRGTGRSKFFFSDGMVVKTVWSFKIVGIETQVTIDQEEVIGPVNLAK